MQSGGIGFINFDEDISKYLTEADDDESVIEQFRELMIDLTQLLRFILVFLANQRFVFLICFTVFYKF